MFSNSFLANILLQHWTWIYLSWQRTFADLEFSLNVQLHWLGSFLFLWKTILGPFHKPIFCLESKAKETTAVWPLKSILLCKWNYVQYEDNFQYFSITIMLMLNIISSPDSFASSYWSSSSSSNLFVIWFKNIYRQSYCLLFNFKFQFKWFFIPHNYKLCVPFLGSYSA